MNRSATCSRVCEGCGGELEQRRPNQLYHDNACRQRAFYRRQHSTATIPADLAERAWEAADGDGFRALDAALTILARIEAVAA